MIPQEEAEGKKGFDDNGLFPDAENPY